MLCVLVEPDGPTGKVYVQVRNREGHYRAAVVDEQNSCLRRDWVIEQMVRFMIERGQG